MKEERSKYRPAESGGAILSRRGLFELAGLAVATAAIPPGAVMAKPSPSGDSNGQGVSLVMDKLSRYMSEASGRALPDEVTEKTFAADTRARGARIRWRLWWKRGRDRSCLENCMRPDRGGTDQWSVGPRR